MGCAARWRGSIDATQRAGRLIVAGVGTAIMESASGDAARTQHVQVVCTLAQGHYFYGVAALINSVVRSGFEGVVVVGYRGERPHWLRALAHDSESDCYAIAPSVRLRFLKVAGPWHLSNCKPQFLEEILFNLYPNAELVYYFDTDIVIAHSWSAFDRWVRGGVVLTLDPADTYMSPHHVYRRAWRELAEKQGRATREFTGYVNGGCVGISRAHAEFASVWRALIEELERDGADMRKMKNATGKLEFARMDQDILNATIMATDVPISLLGPETMGLFPFVGMIMPHAMWQRKPWERNYIFDALRGFPPERTHRAYWDFVDGPIYPFTRFALFRKRTQLAIGRSVGLLHSRSSRDL